MPTPFNRIDDGNYNIAQQNGSIVLDWPLASVGDFNHFTAKVMRAVDVRRFVAPLPMDQRSFDLGDAYLVDLTDPSRDGSPGGSMILNYTELYASLPVTRIEYTTIVYTQQFADIVGQTFEDAPPITRDAQVTYEYSLVKPLVTLEAPKLYVIGGVLFESGHFTKLNDGDLVLAEDSSTLRYLGLIWCRRSVRIVWRNKVEVKG